MSKERGVNLLSPMKSSGIDIDFANENRYSSCMAGGNTRYYAIWGLEWN